MSCPTDLSRSCEKVLRESASERVVCCGSEDEMKGQTMQIRCTCANAQLRVEASRLPRSLLLLLIIVSASSTLAYVLFMYVPCRQWLTAIIACRSHQAERERGDAAALGSAEQLTGEVVIPILGSKRALLQQIHKIWDRTLQND